MEDRKNGRLEEWNIGLLENKNATALRNYFFFKRVRNPLGVRAFISDLVKSF